MRNAVKSSLVLGVIFSMGLALSFASCGAPSTCASLTCDDGGSGGGDGGKHDGSDASVADSGFDASVADSGFDASVADSGFDASVADSGFDASVADSG